MDIFTHALFGGLLYLVFMKDVNLQFFFLAVFCVILPDLDIFLGPLKRVFKSKYLQHRGGSHSFVIGALISLVVGGVYSLIFRQPFLSSWIVAMVFYGLHVAMDLLTTTSVPFLFPISKKEVSFNAEKAGSLFTMINSLAFLILIVVLFYNSVDFIVYIVLINVYTALFLIYYAFRILSKIFVSLRLNDGEKVFPGVLPSYFTIFSNKIDDKEIISSIERINLFSKKKIIYNNSVLLAENELELFNKGLAWCNDDYYFAKWTKFPVFIRKQNKFIVRLYFVEIMNRQSSLYVQLTFNHLDKDLLSIKQGRGRF
ncbi:MAG: metal-dependent hydrolase [Candidatus Lokiarchaeota archaeon]|nr:metal-dependent hydrolase [Candidatus Lokiarchaeota archaeon]